MTQKVTFEIIPLQMLRNIMETIQVSHKGNSEPTRTFKIELSVKKGALYFQKTLS